MLIISNVEKTFNKGTINEKKALNGVNLELKDGDFVTVIGGNGAGKSTMLNMIAGVYPIDKGKIILNGENISKFEKCLTEKEKEFWQYLKQCKYFDYDVVGVEKNTIPVAM